jgi:hypothetical protein
LAVAAVPLVVVAFVPFLRRLPSSTRHRLLGAGLLFVTGAMGFEMLSALFALDAASLPYVLVATAEEMLEMLGVAVLVYALLVYLAEQHPKGAWRIRYSPSA